MDSNSLYNYKCILQKINHKPLILEKIFSFSENRPFILITLISRSALLKENLKTIFNNVKLNNNLSLELNDNIKKYINYRKSIEKLVELFNDSINRFNTQNIVNTLDNNFLNFKPDISKENNYSYLENIFNVFESKIDMNKYIVFYIKLFRLENDINLLHNILLHIRHLSNYDYRHMKLIIEYLFDINCLGYLNLKIENYHDFYFKALENCIYEGNYEDDMINYVFYYLIFPMIKYSAQENNKDLFLEIIKLSMFYINNHVFLEKRKLDSPYIIFKENLKKISKNFFTENKQQFLSLIDNKNNSFLEEIFFDNNIDEQFLKLIFDLISSEQEFFIYFLPYKKITQKDYNIAMNNYEDLDLKYLKYLEKYKINQKIRLICIIDNNKYYEKIDIITYPYIYQIHFELFNHLNYCKLIYSLYTNIDFDNLIKEYNYCMINIFSIFCKYYNSIKYKSNINQISFGNEFFYGKEELNKIFKNSYNQSLICYLIDQFFDNYNLDHKNIFENMNIENIIINEEMLNKLHIYERIKVLYGLNCMFPKLKNKRIIKLNYKDIINNILKLDIIPNYKYKLIEIDFNIDNIVDINKVIEEINTFFSKKEFIYINDDIEILLFTNVKIKINYSNLLFILKSCSFYIFKNIKDFIIKTDNNNNIEILPDHCKNEIKEIKTNNFPYLYIGYNDKNQIKYCRTGINRINSFDIYNIFKYEYEIIKLELKYEKIMIILNRDKTELKIINTKENENKTNDDGIIHYYSLYYLSEFIYSQNNLLSLIINGFDFDLNDIKNNNIIKLYINYNYDKENDIKINNLLNINNHNIINNFPKLE